MLAAGRTPREESRKQTSGVRSMLFRQRLKGHREGTFICPDSGRESGPRPGFKSPSPLAHAAPAPSTTQPPSPTRLSKNVSDVLRNMGNISTEGCRQRGRSSGAGVGVHRRVLRVVTVTSARSSARPPARPSIQELSPRTPKPLGICRALASIPCHIARSIAHRCRPPCV